MIFFAYTVGVGLQLVPDRSRGEGEYSTGSAKTVPGAGQNRYQAPGSQNPEAFGRRYEAIHSKTR